MKISWKKNKEGKWKADLLLAESGGFERWNLSPGRSFSFEVTDERRCTGFAPAKGERSPCPEFREISSGSQCPECRGKDIYSDYVRGDTQTDLEGDFSVYMVQIADQVKVGVTKSGNCMRRWVEQGADYGAEMLSGLSSKVALENEQRISSNGTSERISKRNKTETSASPKKLREKLEEENFEVEIRNIQEETVYPKMETSSFQRKGLFEGELRTVKGQIISNGRLALGLTSGKVVKKPEQKGLNSF